VLAGLAKPVRLEGPDPALLQAAYGEISAETRGRAIPLG
jgi:3-dehydroquinate synthase